MRIGIDIADVDQLGALAAKPRFLEIVFTPEERAGAQTRSGRRRTEYLAGRFAGKEAVVKLLGTGFVRDAWWRDVEIVADTAGAPVARLHRGAAAVARRLGAEPIALSISHKGPWAIAVAASGGQAEPVR